MKGLLTRRTKKYASGGTLGIEEARCAKRTLKEETSDGQQERAGDGREWKKMNMVSLA